MSSTVMIDVHVLVLPAASLTVRVTVLDPILEQLKVVLLSVRIRLPSAVQLSEEPLLTWAVVSVACPELFSVSVTS